MIVHAPQVVAVRHRREGAVERQDLQAVSRQIELADDFRPSSDTTYEQTEKRKPGKTSSVTAAPPTTCRRSSTSTFRPARAR